MNPMLSTEIIVGIGRRSLVSLFGVAALSLSAAANPVFTTIDVPGAIDTVATSIDNSGAIAGYYYVNQSTTQSYLRTPDGTIETFTPFGASFSLANGINDASTVVGAYFDGQQYKGYFRTSDGTISAIPCSEPLSINNRGVIIGVCNNSGFVRATNGKITTFDPPESDGTHAVAINSSGEIAGFYLATSQDRGFVRAASGAITTFDAVQGATVTHPFCINDRGTSAGFYFDQNNKPHGFLRAEDGTITTYDTPSTIYTATCGINSNGSVVGAYSNSKATYAYLRNKAGKIRKFSPEVSVFTEPQGINKDGSIAGLYYDTNSPRGLHGFLLTGFR